MKTIMNQLLEALRERVAQNLATIRQNEVEIKKILAEPLSNQRTYNLNNRYKLSKEILHENKENIEMQNKIIVFLSTYKDVPEYTKNLNTINSFEQEVKETQQNDFEKINTWVNQGLSRDKSAKEMPVQKIEKQTEEKIDKKDEKIAESIFELTVKGDLVYNKVHPLYNNNEFYDRLLDYHTQREEYEVCAQLVKTRK